MARPTSPSWPHRSAQHPELHVDLQAGKDKLHVPVKDRIGAAAIGVAVRSGDRAQKGRK
jgi:hypothetical protein